MIAGVMCIVAFCCEGYLSCSFTFLLLSPDYICVRGGVQFDCDAIQTCQERFNRNSQNGLRNGYYVDWNSHQSLHNWIEDFDLRCSPKWYIGLFGSLYFVGQVFGTPFMAHLGDKYGRVFMLKRVVLVTLACHVMMLTFAKGNITFNFMLIFLNGFVSNSRSSLSYLYGQEIVHRNDTSIYGSVIMMVDAMTMGFFALIFRYLTKHWELC